MDNALYLLPLIAALIGWITNYIAVQMLFNPRLPHKFIFFTIQGVFPKRQKDLAKKISAIIATEFLASEDLEKSFGKVLHSEELRAVVSVKAREVIQTKICEFIPMVPPSYAETLAEKVLSSCQSDFDGIVDLVVKKLANSDAIPDMQVLIENRIASFPVDKLESLCKTVMHREFKFIELIGGVLGFIIGVIQMFIAAWA